MSKYPFPFHNNFLNSTNSYENDEDHNSLKSYDNLSSLNEINNVNQRKSSKVILDNFKSEFNFKIMSQFLEIKKIQKIINLHPNL